MVHGVCILYTCTPYIHICKRLTTTLGSLDSSLASSSTTTPLKHSIKGAAAEVLSKIFFYVSTCRTYTLIPHTPYHNISYSVSSYLILRITWSIHSFLADAMCALKSWILRATSLKSLAWFLDQKDTCECWRITATTKTLFTRTRSYEDVKSCTGNLRIVAVTTYYSSCCDWEEIKKHWTSVTWLQPAQPTSVSTCSIYC